jgi:hypothetical protein
MIAIDPLPAGITNHPIHAIVGAFSVFPALSRKQVRSAKIVIVAF